MRAFIAFVSLCLPLLAHADCKDRFTQWANALQPGRTVDADHAACKVWPENPAQTLAVLPLPQKGASEDQTVYDVEVLVADSNTGAVLAHQYQPSAITSDAMALESIELDTAAWRLTPQQLAFGVRQTFDGSSRVNPAEQTQLSLYVVEGRAIRRVLGNLTTRGSNGEWDGDCAGQFTDTSRVISMGPAGHGGYATLIVRENTVNTTKTGTGDQCKSRSKTTKRPPVTLQYDGSRYDVPAAFSGD